jgi:hypothetical protein
MPAVEAGAPWHSRESFCHEAVDVRVVDLRGRHDDAPNTARAAHGSEVELVVSHLLVQDRDEEAEVLRGRCHAAQGLREVVVVEGLLPWAARQQDGDERDRLIVPRRSSRRPRVVAQALGGIQDPCARLLAQNGLAVHRVGDRAHGDAGLSRHVTNGHHPELCLRPRYCIGPIITGFNSSS